jgi:hypothetical protein
VNIISADRYYSIIAKTIAATGRHDREARAAVYEHIRRQLDELVARSSSSLSQSDQVTHFAALEHATHETAIDRTRRAPAAG